ncbi:MAG: response regulator [Pirellulaceae bacterium]
MKLLLVDDESLVLRATSRAISTNEPDWEIITAESAAEALGLINAHEFDCVVTDVQMPQMDGVELLDEVRRSRPELVRIILSGQMDNKVALRAIQPMHRYLSKPCDTDLLIYAIESSTTTQNLCHDPALKKALGSLSTLPTLPQLYQEICSAIDDPDGNSDDVGKIIQKDPTVTAKILQVVNSALFAFSRRINSIENAVSILGFSLIRSLVLTAQIINDGLKPIKGLSAQMLFEHSFRTALVARIIGRHERVSTKELEAAFTASLLHDLGKVILLDRLPEKLEESIALSEAEGISIADAETKVIGCNHAAVGGALLQMWGLAQETIEAVTLHHNPGLLSPSDDTNLSTITFAANQISNRRTFLPYEPIWKDRFGDDVAKRFLKKFQEWEQVVIRTEEEY